MTNWNEHFIYDETSLSCLRWARSAANNRIKAGDVAGCIGSNYYRVKVGVGQRTLSLPAHRIIWEMFYGDIPDKMVIDHLDRNKLNNRIDNLTIKTNRQNCQNRLPHPDNKSGACGVHRKFNGLKSYYWCAQWNDISGKRCVKNFSIEKYGEAVAYDLAVEARLAAIEHLNSIGENYTEKHGKEDNVH